MNKNAIFDGQQHASPLFVILFIVGVFVCAIAPPLGLMLIASALVQLRFFRSKRRTVRDLAYQQAVEKRRRARLLALKAMP